MWLSAASLPTLGSAKLACSGSLERGSTLGAWGGHQVGHPLLPAAAVGPLLAMAAFEHLLLSMCLE